MAGIVTAVYVKEGYARKKGQVMVELDDRVTETVAGRSQYPTGSGHQHF